MSLIASAVEGRPAEYYFALANTTSTASATNWYLYPSLNGTVQLVDASGTQLLQSIDGQLFYNNQLLASASSIQNISDWSLYPVLNSTGVNFNNFALRDASSIQSGAYIGSTASISSIASVSLLTSALSASTASISSLSAINFSLNALNVSSISTNYINVNGGVVDHVNSITLSQISTYGTLTSPDGDSLLWNGSNISNGLNANWALSPANSTIRSFPTSNLNILSQNCNVNITAGSSINLLSPVTLSSINGVTYYPTQDWSGFFAKSDVVLDGYTLYGGTNKDLNLVSQQCNVNLTSQLGQTNIASLIGPVNIQAALNDVNITGFNNANVDGTDVNITADAGLFNPLNTPNVNIVAKNGPTGGKVLLQGFAGEAGTAGFGRVSIEAFGSSNPIATAGGLIDITAYSGALPANLFTATSAVRMNGASVGISAGALNAFPSLAGSLTMYGNNIVSICAGIPAVLPQIPLTIYGFAPAGITWDTSNLGYIDLRGEVFAPSIQPQNNDSNLIIHGRGSNQFVDVLDVSRLWMGAGSNVGEINFVSTFNSMTVGTATLSNISSLGAQAINVSSINGYTFPQITPLASTISSYTQLYASSLNVSTINALNSTITISAPVGSGLILAGDLMGGGFLDINNQNTVSTLNFAALGNDVGGTYLGANANTDFSYLWLNSDGTAGIELVAPRSNVFISAETDVIIAGPSSIVLSTPSVNVSGGDIINVININGTATSSLTVFSSADIGIEATNDLYLESQSGTTSLNGSVAVNVNCAGGAISLISLSTVNVLSCPLNMNNQKILNVSSGTVATDGVNYGQLTARDSTEFYVSAQGSDTNNGSILAPLQTIQAAITKAELVSSAALICVINVASGHYVENLTFNKGYVVLNGSLQSQTGNEVCEITGSISIALTGANDVFNRQVTFQGFNLTCGAGQAITDTSSSSHTVTFQDCKAFVDSRFFFSTASCPDMRFYMTNVEVQQTNAAATLPVIVTNVGLVELERLDVSLVANISALVIGGTSVLNRLSLATLDTSNAAATLLPLLSITSSTTTAHSLGNVAFAFTSATVKTASNAITIASSVNTAIIMLNCVFTLTGTGGSTNYCVSYNAVGSPTIAGVNNTSLNVNVSLPGTVTVQPGITQIQYTNIDPPGLASYSSTLDQVILIAGTPQALTYNTTLFNQGTTLVLASRVYVTAQGNYALNYKVELQHAGGGATQIATTFLKKNGATIANTGSQWSIPSGSFQNAASATYIIALNIGDYVEVFFNGDTSLSANATAAAGALPASPSVVFNIQQVR